MPPDPRAAICADAGTSPPFSLVQQIFNNECVTCHLVATDLVLAQGQSYANLVGQPAPVAESCGGTLVVAGDPASSYLYQKVSNPHPCSGTQMPAGEFGPVPLPACVIAIIHDWIANGALGP
jgi:hypothetical protein